MSIQNIPEIFYSTKNYTSNFYVYDFKMTEDAVNSKVNLTLNMFSFLQTGEKKVRFEDTFVEVNNKQSVLIKSGNCLMTELLNNDEIYFCKLFFFSNEQITYFFEKHAYLISEFSSTKNEKPFFVIENDEFIQSFVQSISSILQLATPTSTPLLAIKFEEIMLYLSLKYGRSFVQYIQAVALPEKHSSFRKIIDSIVYSNLGLNEIAFLANMSLSTFKRHFEKEYQMQPGKWLQQKRLQKAKQLIEKENLQPTEIFADFGYRSLSNFSAAYKNEFGYSPKNSKPKNLK